MKTSITLLLINIFILSYVCSAQNGHWQWAVTAQGGTAETRKITTDHSGNVYATGVFEGSIQLGNNNFDSRGRKDAWLAKYNDKGEVLWAKSIGSTENDAAVGVTTDVHGNVYITGDYGTTLHLTPTDSLPELDTMVNGHFYTDIFIIKYSSNGDLMWSRSIGSKYEEHATDIKADSRGYIYSTGLIASNSGSPEADSVKVYFTNDTVTTYKGSDAYIARYDTLGNVNWIKAIGEIYGDEEISSLAIDSTSNIYIGGGFAYSLTIDNITMESNQLGFVSGDIFVAKLDSTGKALWAKNASPQKTNGGISPGLVYPPFISLVHDALYIAGSFWGCDLYFPGITPTKISAEAEKAYLAKYHAPSGSLEWVQSLGTGSQSGAHGITTDKEDNAYILTVWNQNFRLGKYDKTGESVYEEYVQGGALQTAICTGADGGIYVGGAIGSSIKFGSYGLSPTSSQNMFIAKFQSYPTAVSSLNNNPEIAVYPNPTNGVVSIGNIPNEATISITDIYGRQVMEVTPMQAATTLSIHKLPQGNYIISIGTADGKQIHQQTIVKL